MKRFFFFNNIIVNNILIYLKKDDLFNLNKRNWIKKKLINEKTFQENMGFSNQKNINKVINIVHKKVQETYNKECLGKGAVMDIGCGVGLYLEDFNLNIDLTGIDLSKDFIKKARKLFPRVHFYNQNFMDLRVKKKFNFIYSISVIQYIPPSKLVQFFEKVYRMLKINGVFLIQYPHALNYKDCLYPDLSYVKYSPLFVNKSLKSVGFKILTHQHSLDGRHLNFEFDHLRYESKFENSFENGAFIIVKKNE